MATSARTLVPQETGWVGRLFNPQSYTPEYQALKFALHRKLLDRINLEALSSVASERVRNEVLSAVAKLVEEERTPLNISEKDRVIEEHLGDRAAGDDGDRDHFNRRDRRPGRL